ncbi:ras GTPase-activating-like protein IQGAP3 isoform X1 [Clarias gariepinus]|uniref:ras GTPase-activating-like protein IQGAP3 isoform X1 n=1 Tax=Clarias gariepinus TaxID=13013 RepID=UPI00234C7568|nr:ras GTPase-activating-like protein IQGAP3 isoform X1 [Clarias gariepinus]
MGESGGQVRSGYERLTAEEMDEQRIQNVAYQYLCRLEEAKRWMEACLKEELPPPTELEEALRNGVLLAKLGHCFAPKIVPLKRIYDHNQERYKAVGLQFRHTDNINHWRNSLVEIGLPTIFYPETTDIYDKKNMPRTVYCIHALSLYLFRQGLAPQIHDLCGKVKFTDEEINNMKLELDKYGIQMPAFSKIGGILANELSVDEAAVHAAVIAINEAVDRGCVEDTAQSLRNPNAMLTNLQDQLMAVYQEMLRQARAHKAAKASSKTNGSTEKDIYEEYLTQSEIQDNITKVNVRAAVERVDEAIDCGDALALLSALQNPNLSLRGLLRDNSDWYLEQLTSDREQKALDLGCVDPLERDELQEGISVANEEAQHSRTMLQAISKINEALRSGESRQTVRALMNPDAHLPDVYPFAAELYQRELSSLQKQCPQGGLQQEELYVAVEMLSAVALINQALEAKDMGAFCARLLSPAAGLADIDDSLIQRYFEELSELKWKAGRALLTWNELQSGVNGVNMAAQEEHDQILTIGLINQALSRSDPQKTLAALLLLSSGLVDVVPQNGNRYHDVLTCLRKHKAEMSRDPGAELWLADIQEGVSLANQDTQKALKRSLGLAAVNQAVKEGKASQTLRVMRLPEVALRSVVAECAAAYQTELSALLRAKHMEGDNKSPWIRTKTVDGSSYYFHLQKLEGTWERPHGFVQNSIFLSHEEIQAVCSSATMAHSREVQWKASELLVVQLQARARGFLLRQKLSERLHFLNTQLPAIITIQSHWRRCLQQRAYRERLEYLYQNWRAVVKIQAWVKMWLARRRHLARLRYFRRHVGAIIRIQAFFRANRAREEYRMLVHSSTPPLSVVRKFAHLLELGDNDIRQEGELLRLREEVVRTIRSNRQLESDLDLMDLKIGLLVRNRVTLQEVVSHHKKLTKKNKEELSDMMALDRHKGLKSLSKDKREKLEAYQHLFYLLQTQPSYLAQLIFLMPQNKSTRFMETVIFTLFNYGSDCREAYLLLQLFTAALRHEIKLKVDQPQEVVMGNPTVIKMLVSFYRHARGQNALREILGPVVREVLQDRTLSIRIDPVEIYKSWINQTESQTGHKSTLPYEVSAEQALCHPEVQQRLSIAMTNLKTLTDRVLQAITSNLHKLPYGLRYTAKVLRDSLHEKFPQASEAELYKIVGNLVYYRYMNPAVVAPDGFDVVEFGVGSALLPDQRRTLGSIARILQHSAAHKPFLGDSAHLRALNDYITHTHSKFRKFLKIVCDVPEPEERFNIDEYSEMVILNKPVVYISIGELINTHRLLLEHQDALCPDQNDALFLLLRDLGKVPSVQALVGEGVINSADPNLEQTLAQYNKMEVSLTLTSKFDVFKSSDENPDARGILLSTKQLIIDVIRAQPGDTLSEVLRSSISRDQEVQHDWMMHRRAQRDARTPEKMKRNKSLIADSNLTLEEKKRKILRSLRRLEALGVLTPPDSETQILQLIAKDIRHQRLHRQRRQAELVKLKHALHSLNCKSSFHSEQIDYYSQYISTCLHNLTTSQTNGKKAADSKGKKSKQLTLTYTAARLHEKGVLLEIEDLPVTQFKNVIFDIIPSEEGGTFLVKARFLGVDMERFPLKYQDLLQLQYEGVAVMKMFDKAKVNVNLLIFLLNKKFFKK